MRNKTTNLALLICTVLTAVLVASGTAVAEPQRVSTDGREPDPSSPPQEPDGKEDEEKEPRTVNLLIQGTEPDRWNLDFGGGVSERSGLYGRIALHTTNFLGRGEAFGATVEVGDEHELFEVQYQRPFLFGRRQSLGIRLFMDETEYSVTGNSDFSRRRTGAALTYGRRFGLHHRFALEYRFTNSEETEASFADNGGSLVRQTSYASSSLRPRWVYDRLDDRLNPFRGLRLDAAMEVAGGVLGGEADLIKPTFGLAWFQPLSRRPVRSTFGIRARLGWLESTGDELFSQQRFFLGGQNSVRGFDHRSIAVRADDGSLARDEQGFPLGGESMAQLNLEYHMLFGERFRVVLFADTGGVFSGGVDTSLLRSSAGAELRFSVPRLNLPLRLIYAQNLDPLPEDRFDNFSFSVGVSF